MGVVRKMLKFQDKSRAFFCTFSIFLTTPIRPLRGHLPRKGEGWSPHLDFPQIFPHPHTQGLGECGENTITCQNTKTQSGNTRRRAYPAPAPDEPLAFDDDGIKRVQDIIRNARATWFALLGALVFASVTLASVKDISFFVNTVETKLPIVGISVPVVSFFWAGSLLIAALYAYFHLYLELLWQALGDFPARDKKGALLADRIEPWIVADTALRFRDWLRKRDTG